MVSAAEQTQGPKGSEICERSKPLEVRQIQRVTRHCSQPPAGQEAGTIIGKLPKPWYGEARECRVPEPCVVWPHSILPPGDQRDSHDAC